MIQETKRLIAFTPYTPEKGRKADEDPPPSVTINTKFGNIIFPLRTVNILGMENKFIAFYYESTKRIIGFSFRDKLSETELKLGKWRLVKLVKVGKPPGTDIYRASISGIFKNFKAGLKPSYKKIEVKKYVEKDSMMDRGKIFYYVELENEYDHKTARTQEEIDADEQNHDEPS